MSGKGRRWCWQAWFRLFIVAPVAAIFATSLATADDILSLGLPSSNPVATLAPGRTVTVKAGEVIYAEDEGMLTYASLLGEFDKGSSFWGNARSAGRSARLRESTFNGEAGFCDDDSFALRRNKGVLCFFDGNNDKAFEVARALIPSRPLGFLKVSAVAANTDRIEPPIAYKSERAYGSTGGLRVVYRYRGIADGKVAITCRVEAKGTLPVPLQQRLDQMPGVLAEETFTSLPPAGAPVSVSLPLCLAVDLLTIGKQRRAPFEIQRLLRERMLQLEVTNADAKAMSLRLIRPLAGWIVQHEVGPDGTTLVSVEQVER